MLKQLLLIFGLVLASLIVLVFIYFKNTSGKNGNNIRFTSNHDQLTWVIDHEKFLEVEKEIFDSLEDPNARKTKIEIKLSKDFKKTVDGTGYKNFDPFIFSDWVSSGTRKTLNIYVDLDIWTQIPNEDRDKILTYFVSRQLLLTLGAKTELFGIVSEKGTIIGLERKI